MASPNTKDELFGLITNVTKTLLNSLECKISKSLTNAEYMRLYNGITDFANKGPKKNGKNLHEMELFDFFSLQITIFFQGIQKQLEKKTGISYLEEFVECSTNFTLYAGWLVRLFKYLDLYYLKLKGTDLCKESFLAFKSLFLKNIQYDIFIEVFFLLDIEREGFDSKKTLILKVIQFYFMMCYDKDIKLDYDKENKQFHFTGKNEKQDYHFYKTQFEAKLLENIKNFYLNKISNKWLTESSADFIFQSLEAFKREENMALTYYPLSKDIIKEKMKKIIIIDYFATVLDNPKSGLKIMLWNNSNDDLKNCYKLYIQDESILKQKICAIFKEFIEEKSKKIATTPLSKLKNIQEITQCFESFIQFKKELEYKLEHFNNFLEIEKTIDDRFYSFFRNDDSARYLAIYFDFILRKIQRQNGQDLEISSLIKLFKYLSSRDEFFEVYKKKLIARILDETIKSFDYEKDCLSKLKQECGVLSTIMNCESILQDTEGISKSTTKFFKDWLKQKECQTNFDFDIKILEKSSYAAKNQQNFELIAEVHPIISMFHIFYQEINQNRLIEFIYQDGISEISFKTNKYYRLTIFNDSLPIFLLFNTSISLEKKDILMKTNLSEKVLDDRLNVCEKLQILLKVNKNNNDKLIYTVNTNFRSDKISYELHKIKITKDAAGIKENTTKIINESEEEELKIKRQNALDAALVRIMKSRITMTYNELLGDCRKIVQHIFIPEVSMIRKRIESLMERGYMGRDENDSKILMYIS